MFKLNYFDERNRDKVTVTQVELTRKHKMGLQAASTIEPPP